MASGDQLVQPSCSRKTTWSGLHRTTSRQILNISKGVESADSLSNLFQCSVTHTVKKCFLMFRGNLLFQFLTIASCSGTSHVSKEPGFFHFVPALQVFIDDKIPPENPLLQAEQSQLCLFSHEGCSSPFTILVALCWWPVSLCVSCTEEPRVDHRAPSLTKKLQGRNTLETPNHRISVQ